MINYLHYEYKLGSDYIIYIYIKLYDTYNLVTYIYIFKYCITKYFDGSQYDIV